MTWPTKKLGEVCEVVGGGTPSTGISTYWEGDIVWVTPKDMGQLSSGEISDTAKKITRQGVDNSSAKLLPAGSVILSSRAPIGYVAVNTVPMATNQGCRSFICSDQILNKYLYYFLIKSRDYLQTLGSGSTFLEVSGSRLKEIEIPLPPIAEQKRIVARIEKQFAKIDEAARLRAESVSATGQLLPAALHEIFSSAKSKGWDEKMVGEVSEINPSKSEMKNITEETFVSFVPMSAVNEYSQSIERQEEKEFKAVNKGYTYFKRGDILFAKITPCMENGKVAHTTNLKREVGFGSTEFHVLRGHENSIVPAFLYHIVRSNKFRKEAEKRMTGSAGQKRVPREFIANYKIPLPPLVEQKEIVKRLDALSLKVRALQELQSAQAADLKALKQSILHQAFSGKA